MLEKLVFWHWWILAVVLIVVEMVAPGTFFLWMGISAAVMGFLLLLFPAMAWELQLSVFSVLSVISVLSWRLYLKKNPIQTDRPTLNRRGEQYVGRTFTLAEPIVDGIGKIKVDDSTWKVKGADCELGVKVKVVGVDGVILEVERI